MARLRYVLRAPLAQMPVTPARWKQIVRVVLLCMAISIASFGIFQLGEIALLPLNERKHHFWSNPFLIVVLITLIILCLMLRRQLGLSPSGTVQLSPRSIKLKIGNAAPVHILLQNIVRIDVYIQEPEILEYVSAKVSSFGHTKRSIIEGKAAIQLYEKTNPTVSPVEIGIVLLSGRERRLLATIASYWRQSGITLNELSSVQYPDPTTANE